MKVLITGGAGFIGSHLAKRLLKDNHEVAIVDSLHPYYSPSRKKQHLKNIRTAGDFPFYEVNLLDREGTFSVFHDVSPETVIHLAALPGVAYSIKKPLEYVDYDIKATINVLEAAGEKGASEVIFASSSSVYGTQNEGPFREEMASGRVLSPYAAAKVSAEAFCHVYESLYDYRMKILRFFTVYGPWGRPDMAIAGFIKNCMDSREITVFGNGSSRDYTYIDDLIEGICLAMTKLKGSDIVNIGSGRAVPMETLLQELGKYFPDMKIRRKARRVGDVPTTWADLSKAKRLMGYEPAVDFETGIQETIKWALKNEQYL